MLGVLIYHHCDGLQSEGQLSEVLCFYGAYSYYRWYLAQRGGHGGGDDVTLPVLWPYRLITNCYHCLLAFYDSITNVFNTD